MTNNIGFPTSGHYHISKPIQYVEEGLTGTEFGVTPTASPTFLLIGAVQSLNDTSNNETFIKRQIGRRNYYKNQTIRHRYTFELKWAPFNSTFLKYGSEEANAAGTIAASISIAKIQKLNNAGVLADSFTFYKGCRMQTLDINIAGAEVEATASFVAREKSVPVFTANGGLTTPTWKEFSDVTATPWTHLDGGANPLTINSVQYPIKNFHIQWNNNLGVSDINGSDFIDENPQTNRDISGDFTVIVGKDFNLETDIHANPVPARAATYILKTATSQINMTDLMIKQDTDKQDSGQSMPYEKSFTFECANAVIT